jgi:hypothetical protein
MSVSNEFKSITKKIKQQNIKLSICDGELTVKEIHMMPVHIFNALPVWKLRKQKETIAKELKYSFDGQLFKTIMKQVEITVKNANEIKDKDINFQYGLFINNKFEYIDLGNYFIKDIEDSKKKDEITVTGYDRMIRFMKTFKQSELQLTYPCKMLKLVQKMCEVCGVELYSTDFYNADLDVEEDFFTAQELTYRDVLEKVVQATLTTAFIEDNKLNLYKVDNEVTEKLDKSYLTDLTIKEKFGPANALVLGRGDVEDNIEETDEKSIAQNGRCEIRFDENEFIEFQREKVIKGMFEQIKGLEYYSFEASDVGVMWLKPCVCIELGDKEDSLYKSYYLKANITINTGISSDIEAELPEETNTEYKVTTKEEKKTLKVERLAKKNEGKIQDLVEESTENSKKLTEHEQTIDSINDKVSNIADLTENATGVTELTLNNCINGELLTLNIYGNNTVFKYQFMSDELLFGDNVTLGKDASILIVTDKENNSTEYNLNVIDELRQNGEVRDEYMIKSGQAQIIRRINSDGTIKDNEEIEDIGEIHIVLQEGVNILKIKYFNAEIQAKWATKSDLANTFATKVEMNTSISQTSSQIMTEVNKKVDNAEFGTKMIQDYESVRIAWNKISDFIKMMVFNNNASLCLADNSNNVIASFDKEGEHFYKSGEVTPFGEMGVQTVDDKQYIAFSVEGEYEKDIDNGMAWGIKTKSDGKFYPIFYIKDFSMGAKNSDTWGGSLVLTACDILLNGIGTGITTGGVRIEGDPAVGALYFYDVNTNNMMMGIFPQQGARYETINILDKISFFKNQAGSNSFRIGTEDCNCLLSDEGHIMRKRNLCK